MQCAFCEKQIEILDKVGRQDVCPNCQQDLHCCKQCRFYDPAAYNECHETQAERVLDKEKANFCDYFQFGSNKKIDNNKNETVSKLEALFKK
ncbi:MAG: hypothetical protein ABH859_00460 [Pseudomonadota bacterium]